MYEPIHGSAPDIAGRDIANPLATILSVAMMYRYTFADAATADRIENAVKQTIAQGLRTADIWTEGTRKVSCSEMGDAVVMALRDSAVSHGETR
jgi:3-isopropylmalate dehydrogenase